MLNLTLALSSSQPLLHIRSKHFLNHTNTTTHCNHNRLLRLTTTPTPTPPLISTTFCFNPLRVSVNFEKEAMKKKPRQYGPVCYSAPFTPQTLQWICAVSSAVLMLAKGTSIQKSFLVPLFALQAPASVISWIKSEYGIWTAFLALLVRLFFSIPGELELPFIVFLLVIVAPYQFMNLRGTQEGVMLSLLIVAYLAFHHFSRAGSLQKSFEQGSLVATVSILGMLCVTCLFLV